MGFFGAALRKSGPAFYASGRAESAGAGMRARTSCEKKGKK